MRLSKKLLSTLQNKYSSLEILGVVNFNNNCGKVNFDPKIVNNYSDATKIELLIDTKNKKLTECHIYVFDINNKIDNKTEENLSSFGIWHSAGSEEHLISLFDTIDEYNLLNNNSNFYVMMPKNIICVDFLQNI